MCRPTERTDGRTDGRTDSVYRTLLPDEWAAICADPEQRVAALGEDLLPCAGLRTRPGDRRELAVLAANVRASDRGYLPRGLGDLVFRYRPGLLTPRGVLVARDATSAALINENFSRGRDLGRLGARVRVANCAQPSQTIDGPDATVCRALDTSCARGAMGAEQGCCRAEPRRRGTKCAAGACDGNGQCSASVEVDPLAVEYRGTGEFVAMPAEDRIRLVVDGRVVARIVTDRDAPTPVLTVDPRGAARVIQLRGGAGGAELRLEAQAVPGVMPEICVWRGAIAEGGVLSDCTTPGTLRLLCNGNDAEGVRCTIANREGAAPELVVEAPGPLLVWEYLEEDPTAVHVLGFPAGCSEEDPTDPECFLGSCGGGECSGTPEPCTNRCGLPSFRYCSFAGCWGPCVNPVEACNGVDDDCDNMIDEGTDFACDDGLACTVDVCGASLVGFPICLHLPLNTVCEDGFTCTTDACNSNPPGNGTVVTDTDGSGCRHRLRNNWCTFEWDDCACNGAEQCVADGTAFPDGSGCAFSPGTQWPCDFDNNACTLETCCEPNPNCNPAHFPAPPAGACPPSVEVTSPTGEEVDCPISPFQYLPEPADQIHCEEPAPGGFDGNPCSNDYCDASTGACLNSAWYVGEAPGCEGVLVVGGEETCVELECDRPAGVAYPETRCTQKPQSALCDNELFCDGTETCTPFMALGPDAVPVPGRPMFCFMGSVTPCDDHWDCTIDECDEISDPPFVACRHVKDHNFCRSEAADACAPWGLCEGEDLSPGCVGDDCPSGCSDDNLIVPCDDHNPCTNDACTPVALLGEPPDPLVMCENTPRICLSDNPCEQAVCNPSDNDGDPCTGIPRCGPAFPACGPCL